MEHDARCVLAEVPEILIPVENLSYALGFAGAFTAAALTDPVYFLEPAKKSINGAPDVTGFTVRQNGDAEDKASLGTAAMIHLFHTDPHRWPFLGGNWVPVSFGIGVGEDSKTKYFFGTSLRFDEHLYLTGGIVFGPVNRLPNALSTGSFTTEATALDNLPSRTDAAAFVGISYTFLGRNLRAANGPFMTPFVTPVKAPPVAVDPTITAMTPEAGAKRGDVVTITGQQFGDDIAAIKVLFAAAGAEGKEGTVVSVSNTTITANVPADAAPGQITVTIMKGQKPSNAFSYTITPAQ
jgi:hypothetical protein